MIRDQRVDTATSARIDAYVARVLAEAPPPSPELMDRLADRLRPHAKQPDRTRTRTRRAA